MLFYVKRETAQVFFVRFMTPQEKQMSARDNGIQKTGVTTRSSWII